MSKKRVDEAINRNGKKVRVKIENCYNSRTHLIDNYYIFYDEDEVYHIENSLTKKIILALSCNSMEKARNMALKYITLKDYYNDKPNK